MAGELETNAGGGCRGGGFTDVVLQVKESKERRKAEKLAELRDFLETEAELDAASVDAVLGHVTSMDALVRACVLCV